LFCKSQITINKSKFKTRTLVDTGATLNIIRTNLLPTNVQLGKKLRLTQADGSEVVNAYKKISRIELKIGDKSTEIKAITM
jgi:predicted aspartyl protease